MDPVSAIIGIASSAAGLVALTGQVVTYLIGLRDSHRNVELTILDMIATCQAYGIAWSHIQQWASENSGHFHSQSQDSASILAELKVFLEIGQVIMTFVQRDIDRILPKLSLWRRASRRGLSNTRGLLLHGKAVAEHVARIHRQNTSLNLLISVLTLPSRPLQEAAVEILRPKFRKDEETAWTIVNTRSTPASRRIGRALASCRTSVDLSVCADQFSEHNASQKSFSFEDDLFSGPVYKRLLISRLCEQPCDTANNTVNQKASYHRRNSPREWIDSILSTSVQANHDTRQEIVDTYESTAAASVSEAKPHHSLHDDNTISLELRQQGVFSRSVHEDFCEFMACHRPRKMQRRHLPLALIRTQNRICVDEQLSLNDEFQSAIRQGDLDSAAQALDAGADINCRENGQTALDFCIQKWLDTKLVEPDLPSEYTTMAEFLMLYRETYVTYMFSCRTTILHLCMHIGATAEYMKPFFTVEGSEKALRHLDRYGRSILHTAIQASTSGLFALSQIKRLLGANSIPADLILDEAGVNACASARRRGAYEHLSILVDMAKGYKAERQNQNTKLVGSPRFATDPSEKPFYLTGESYRIFITNPDPVEQLDNEQISNDTGTNKNNVHQHQAGSSQSGTDTEDNSPTTTSSGSGVDGWKEDDSSPPDMSLISTRELIP